MLKSVDGEALFNDIVEMVRWVRSNKGLTVFRGGMEKMSFTQISALFMLHARGEASMTDLAVEFGVKMPTMTDLMSGLVKAGYAERRSAQGDRRKVMMALSAKGKKLTEMNRAAHVAYINRFMAGLTPIERRIAGSAVERIKRIIKENFKAG